MDAKKGPPEGSLLAGTKLGRPYLVNWTLNVREVSSFSPRSNVKHLPAHALSVFHKYVY